MVSRDDSSNGAKKWHDHPSESPSAPLIAGKPALSLSAAQEIFVRQISESLGYGRARGVPDQPLRRRPRRRKPGRRGPERFDADYALKRLVVAVRKKALREGGTEQDAERAVDDLKQLSACTLAEMVADLVGIRRSGKTYRRNSTLYREWKRQEAAKRLQPRREHGGARPRHASQQDSLGRAEIDAGGLSLAGPGPRRTKRRRSREELVSCPWQTTGARINPQILLRRLLSLSHGPAAGPLHHDRRLSR